MPSSFQEIRTRWLLDLSPNELRAYMAERERELREYRPENPITAEQVQKQAREMVEQGLLDASDMEDVVAATVELLQGDAAVDPAVQFAAEQEVKSLKPPRKARPKP